MADALLRHVVQHHARDSQARVRAELSRLRLPDVRGWCAGGSLHSLFSGASGLPRERSPPWREPGRAWAVSARRQALTSEAPMNSPTSQKFLSVVGIAGAFLVVAILVGVMLTKNRPAPLDQSKIDQRKA